MSTEVIQSGANKKRVLLAMSGGVDSSVAALILSRQGYKVIGLTFKNFCYRSSADTQNQNSKACCTVQAVADAKQVCAQIGLPHYVIDVEKNFYKYVVQNFTYEYKHNRTPNPCIRCNHYIRFPILFEYQKKLNADFVATGHYAKISQDDKQYKLERPEDREKDQSYFLYHLSSADLSRILFPLSVYRKVQVREIAKQEGLPVAQKEESQDICFLGTRSTYEYLKEHIETKDGNIVNSDGKIIGRHKGVCFYTIGQRAPIGGTGPYYIYKKDYKTNTLFVTADPNDSLLYPECIEATYIHWINRESIKFPLYATAQTRYRQKGARVLVKQKCKNQNRVQVRFLEKQRAVSPGQSIVFYDADTVLGGGIIL